MATGRMIGRTRNTVKNADVGSSVALNDTTTITVQAENGDRIFFAISNPDNKDIWLKLQSATTDNDKKGIFIPRGGYWEMPIDNIYTGEISSISNSGTPNVFTTEY